MLPSDNRMLPSSFKLRVHEKIWQNPEECHWWFQLKPDLWLCLCSAWWNRLEAEKVIWMEKRQQNKHLAYYCYIQIYNNTLWFIVGYSIIKTWICNSQYKCPVLHSTAGCTPSYYFFHSIKTFHKKQMGLENTPAWVSTYCSVRLFQHDVSSDPENKSLFVQSWTHHFLI